MNRELPVRSVSVMVTLWLVLLAGTAVAGHGGVHCTAEQYLTGTCTVRGGGGASPASSGSPGGTGSSSSGQTAGPYVQRRYVPACGENTLANGGDVMCVAATSFCSGRVPKGQTAFWVYTRLFDPLLGEAAQPTFERQPGYVCLGADEEGVPGIVQVVAQVREDFDQFVVVKGATRIDPAPRTLINVDTIFSTDRTGPVTLAPLTLTVDRAYSVVITLTPESYTWHFGDGTSLTTATPGRPRVKDVTHVYRAAAALSARVDIEWSGTFTVDAGEVLSVEGTVTTTGPPTPLNVLTARSELVRD